MNEHERTEHAHARKIPFPLATMSMRMDIAWLSRTLGLNGVAVEVGTFRGNFMRAVFPDSNFEQWHGVDAFTAFDDYDDSLCDQARLDAARIEARANYDAVHGAVLVEEESVAAASVYKNDNLDLVYIDANHSKKSTREDIEAWWPKVRPGGIMGGHDYTWVHPSGKIWGVVPAVNEFIAEQQLQLCVTHEPRGPSWFVIKPAHNLKEVRKVSWNSKWNAKREAVRVDQRHGLGASDSAHVCIVREEDETNSKEDNRPARRRNRNRSHNKLTGDA